MDALDLVKREKSKLALQPEWADVCFTCGTCASGCPVTGVDGWDPRKAVRAALLGLVGLGRIGEHPQSCNQVTEPMRLFHDPLRRLLLGRP